jgi:hypothetical protein
MITAAQLDQPRMASIRDIADLSDSMRFEDLMNPVRPSLWLSGFFFFWFHSFSKNLEHVLVKTIFYKSLDLPASSGFKKIKQGFKSNTGNELFESGG